MARIPMCKTDAKHKVILIEKYDAYACLECNMWLEPTCDDEDCFVQIDLINLEGKWEIKMAGYIGKIKLDKKLVESNLLLEQDERYDDYYALKIRDDLYHVYGTKEPQLISWLDNCDLARFTEE